MDPGIGKIFLYFNHARACMRTTIFHSSTQTKGFPGIFNCHLMLWMTKTKQCYHALKVWKSKNSSNKTAKEMCCKLVFFHKAFWKAFSPLKGFHQWNATLDLYVLAAHVSRHKISLKTSTPSPKHASVSVNKPKPPTLWTCPKLSRLLSRPRMIIP